MLLLLGAWCESQQRNTAGSVRQHKVLNSPTRATSCKALSSIMSSSSWACRCCSAAFSAFEAAAPPAALLPALPAAILADLPALASAGADSLPPWLSCKHTSQVKLRFHFQIAVVQDCKHRKFLVMRFGITAVFTGNLRPGTYRIRWLVESVVGQLRALSMWTQHT